MIHTLIQQRPHRVTIPANAITKFEPLVPIEIHITGNFTTLKSENISLKIEKLKDPLSEYLGAILYNKTSNFSITFDEPEDSSEPSRMEKLVNWVKQSKFTSCDLLVGPSGVWVGPRGALKKPDFASDEAILAKSLHLDTMPCGNTNRIASFTVSVIKTVDKLGMKSVIISFPDKENDVLCIESLDSKKDYSIVSAKAMFVEVPIAEVASLPVAELADAAPMVIQQGDETLMEVPPTVAEAINTAITEDTIPTEMKESIDAAIKKAEQVVSIKPVEITDAQKAITETAIVEAIDPEKVVNIDTKTKKTAKLLKNEIEKTKAELEKELKSESIDMNRIIALTLRLDTEGGRFIEIVLSLKKNWIPILNIDEKFKEDAAKAYPHLTQ